MEVSSIEWSFSYIFLAREDAMTGEVFELAEELAEGQDVLDHPLIIKWVNYILIKIIILSFTRYHKIQIRTCCPSPSNTSASPNPRTANPTTSSTSPDPPKTNYVSSNTSPIHIPRMPPPKPTALSNPPASLTKAKNVKGNNNSPSSNAKRASQRIVKRRET